MSPPIALQLYSVRQECARDLAGTIEAVALMGYAGVEFAGFHGQSAAYVRRALDATGLSVAGAHTGLALLDDDHFEQSLDDLLEIGCSNVIVPGIPEERRNTPDACLDTARWFSELTDRLGERGFRAGYHCHFGDMVPLANGQTAWYMIAGNTPSDFILQYDTANGMSAGADPVRPILDFPGRATTVHLKEWAGRHGAALIGEGTVPWDQVFHACETVGGTQWYVVEHEDEAMMPPLEAVAGCLANLRTLGK
jgi:sugar phosphate isomerase/epimerase